MKPFNFLEEVDAFLEKIFVDETGLKTGIKDIKDSTIFDDARLTNLRTTILVLVEDHQDELDVLKAPISYIGEDGTWKVANLPVTVLSEVFAQELTATDSLPMAIQFYTEDLEKKFNAK